MHSFFWVGRGSTQLLNLHPAMIFLPFAKEERLLPSLRLKGQGALPPDWKRWHIIFKSAFLLMLEGPGQHGKDGLLLTWPFPCKEKGLGKECLPFPLLLRGPRQCGKKGNYLVRNAFQVLLRALGKRAGGSAPCGELNKQQGRLVGEEGSHCPFHLPPTP